MPIPRLTTRRMMAVVAVAAIIMGGVRLLWLRDAYLKASAGYAIEENLIRPLQRFERETEEAERKLRIAFDIEVAPPSEDEKAQRVERLRLQELSIKYCRSLKEKYARAARRPWLPIEPDPPPPK